MLKLIHIVTLVSVSMATGMMLSMMAAEQGFDDWYFMVLIPTFLCAIMGGIASIASIAAFGAKLGRKQ